MGLAFVIRMGTEGFLCVGVQGDEDRRLQQDVVAEFSVTRLGVLERGDYFDRALRNSEGPRGN